MERYSCNTLTASDERVAPSIHRRFVAALEARVLALWARVRKKRTFRDVGLPIS